MHEKHELRTKKLNRGFTLVELIVSIAVLGIIVVPILTYFTNANKFNAKAKQMQKASNAAQSVLEEAEAYASYQSYNALYEDDGTGSIYNLGGRRLTTPAGETNVYYYSKPISFDGIDYVAQIKMDYSAYDSVSDPAVTAKYNQYEMPNIGVLFSNKNAVALESQQEQDTINYFYDFNNGTISKSSIRSGMSREAILSLRESPTDASKVIVKMVYKYTYGTQTVESLNQLCNNQFAKTDLEKIYWFYLPFDGSDDKLTIEKPDTLTGINYDLYLVRQNVPSVTLNSDYKLSISCSAVCAGSIKGINSNNENVFINGGNPPVLDDLVTTDKKKRMSQVTVTIYPKGTTDFSATDPIGSVSSAKGE